MEKEIRIAYAQAHREVKRKAIEYMLQFKIDDLKMRNRRDGGDISNAEYRQWRRSHLLTGQRWVSMEKTLQADLYNADKIAASIINGHLPEVYAININYGTYQIEHDTHIDTSYTLYDRQTVERLLRDNPDLLPMQAEVNVTKETRWNKQRMNSAVVQGILQGETVEELADRLSNIVSGNRNAALRDAATMATSAQNGGRLDSYKRAQKLGIDLTQRWIATLDGHTRASHRLLDGEECRIGEKFSNGLEFPGDPNGPPEEVYRCRCRTIASFPDQDFSGFERNSRLGSMSYSDWKNAKGDEPLFKAARNVNDDFKQQEQYRKLLGSKKIPYDIRDFQKIKYEQPDEWKKLKAEAAKKRSERRKKGK
ncbi:MAG: hypothetical protein IJ740_13450 [Ruminococcus sp.]|nr:hypothetical protein [Ruminococcus sp.]